MEIIAAEIARLRPATADAVRSLGVDRSPIEPLRPLSAASTAGARRDGRGVPGSGDGRGRVQPGINLACEAGRPVTVEAHRASAT